MYLTALSAPERRAARRSRRCVRPGAAWSGNGVRTAAEETTFYRRFLDFARLLTQVSSLDSQNVRSDA